MKLENHIVKRLLTDESLWTEMILDQAAGQGIDLLKDIDAAENYVSMYELLSNKDNKTYYVTKSVTEKLNLFDTKRCLDIEGWKIFNHIPDFKKTFILHDSGTCIRVFKKNGLIHFCHLDFTFHKKEDRKPNDDGLMYWILLYVELNESVIAEHFNSEDGRRIAPYLYALMCYVLLCDNETVLLEPKQKYGTQKSGKIINTLPLPITVINNTWNVTTVRNGEFWVSGYSAIRWTGAGRVTPKLVFIEPFTKEGYTRRSGKELEKK